MVSIIPNLEIIDLALYHKVNNILIIGDVHIGYEEALNKQGFLLPRFQFKQIIERLEKIFTKLNNKKLDSIIINGDIKHEFGTISEQEWRHTLKLLDFLARHCKEIILIKGNHDTILGPIAQKRNVQIVDSFVVEQQKNSMFIIHGDKIPKEFPKQIKTIIIGHEHPAISLRDGPRIETYKCFLKGKYSRKNLIVMPSFNLVNEGTNLLQEQLLSPFLGQNLSNFEVYIVADKVYSFGKIKNLRS